MTVQITVELSSDPVTAELKFPLGLTPGTTINLILQRTPNLQPHSRCKKDFVIRHAYVHGRPVPVARRQCTSNCHIARAIKVTSPTVGGKALCILQTKNPVNHVTDLLSIFGKVSRQPTKNVFDGKHSSLTDEEDKTTVVPIVDPAFHHSYSSRSRPPVVQFVEASAKPSANFDSDYPCSPVTIDENPVVLPLINCRMCHGNLEGKETFLLHNCPNVPTWHFKCTECAGVFNEEYLLRNHAEKEHQNTSFCQELAYQCGTCRFQTLDGEEALLHSREHLINDTGGDDPIVVFAMLREGPKSSSFSCSVCGEKFPVQKLLEVHQSAMHPLKDVCMQIGEDKQDVRRCDICKKEFSSRQRLLSHQWTHKADRPHKCKVCDCSFLHFRQLTAHTYVHSGDWPYKCPDCPQGFLKEDQLAMHQKRLHDTQPYTCHICSMSYLFEFNLEQHMSRKHPESTPFRCTICEKAFFNKKFLKKHEDKCVNQCSRTGSKQGIRSFLCSYCDSVFLTYKELCDHIPIHSEATFFKCETCGKVSLHSGVHQQHLLSHVKKRSRPQSKMMYPCIYCDRKFKSRKGIQAHMNFHANIRPYGCTLCGASLSSKTNLNAHMVSIHGHPGDDVKCPHCPKVFKLKRSLNIHINYTHRQKFEHECDVCGKKLATERKLQKHKALVHMNDGKGLKEGQENPFPLLKLLACGRCMFKTYSYARMIRHRVDHTGVYPHQCTECDKQFVFKDQLTRHIGVVHRRGPLSCPECPRLFLAEHLYQLHIKTHRSNQGHVCTVCNQYYESAAALEHHGQSHVGTWPFECNICKQRFKFSQGLLVHERFRHRAGKDHFVGDHSWTYACTVCKTRFKYQSSLAAHRLNKHSTERKLECNFCARVFNSQCVLSLHIRTHTGEKPHVCQHCGKAFRIVTNLKNHVVTQHTKEFKVFCPLCSKGMVSNVKLKQHLVQSHKAVSGHKCGKKQSVSESLMARDPEPLLQVIAENPGTLLTQMVI